MSEEILSQQDGPILRITFNRPEHGNGATDGMATELTRLLNTAAEKSRLVVLRGAGKDFCIGRATMGQQPAVMPEALVRKRGYDVIFNSYAAIRNTRIPVIGVVQAWLALVGVPLGRIADRWSRKIGVPLGGVLAYFFSGPIAQAFSYGTLCTYYGLVYSAIQDIVAPAMRGTARNPGCRERPPRGEATTPMQALAPPAPRAAPAAPRASLRLLRLRVRHGPFLQFRDADDNQRPQSRELVVCGHLHNRQLRLVQRWRRWDFDQVCLKIWRPTAPRGGSGVNTL